MIFLFIVLSSWFFHLGTSHGLIDNPIVGDSIIYLDGIWNVSSKTANLSFQTSVPGDLITDLQKNNIILDPLNELNWKNSSLWDQHNWTYVVNFTLTNDMLNANDLLLVFDGVKMGAIISINNQTLDIITDQFVRYNYSLFSFSKQFDSNFLKVGYLANSLSIFFDPNITTDGRYMGCTGGWDWAPYSNTYQTGVPGRAHTFSKGIWKSVYLVVVSSVAITHVVPHLYYTGNFPTQPLIDGNHAPFNVLVRIYFYLPPNAVSNGTLSIQGDWGYINQTNISLTEKNNNIINVTLIANSNQIKLWWPIGYGEQNLYNIDVKFLPSTSSPLEVTRRIGFRYVAVVTGNDTDPAYVSKNAQADGTDSMGMFFRVNGIPIYSRGGNMIPMEELEGRFNSEAYQTLVHSVADANMNTLRVWGGGIWLPDIWYDTCDELGIIVYHDMQYAQLGHDPTNTFIQDFEIRHQVRRLSHHPSIVIWDSCNECDPTSGIYASFVLTTIGEEDTSRPLWPSCPSSGWKSGVNRLSSIPNGNLLIPYNPYDGSGPYLEDHGNYQHGAGFDCVNGEKSLDLFPENIPIIINATNQLGIQYPNVYFSEFGCSVFSSFESMSATLAPEHWGIHAGMPSDNCTGSFAKTCTGNNPMSDRNYPCDNIITVYFGTDNFDLVGIYPFQKQLYQCMLGQALEMKSDIETRRTQNQYGCLTWQLNEIWPTGGWGSLEYGSPVKGQVLGGRWKPLHYWFRKSIFTDIFITCGQGGQCLIRNDFYQSFTGSLEIWGISLSDGSSKIILQNTINLGPGPGSVKWFIIDLTGIDTKTTILVAKAINSLTNQIVCENVILLVTPKNLLVPKATVTFTVADIPNQDGSVDIHIQTDEVALYVTFTTLANGRFSDNAFLLLSPGITIQFIPFGGVLDINSLRSTLRVEHIALYAYGG